MLFVCVRIRANSLRVKESLWIVQRGLLVQSLTRVSHSCGGIGKNVARLVGGLVMPKTLLVVFEFLLYLVMLFNEHRIKSLLAGVS
jgi:hypothetical protein